ncbi:MAG: hypothetical protein ABIL39_03505 [candidate division WOR-3 bacterium]
MYRVLIVIVTYDPRSLYVKRLVKSLFQMSVKKIIMVVKRSPFGYKEDIEQITAEKERV